MDVLIDEISTTVEVASDEGVLEPAVLRQVMDAVFAQLRDQDETRRWEAAQRAPGGRRGRLS
jgi:hypothetical protein